MHKAYGILTNSEIIVKRKTTISINLGFRYKNNSHISIIEFCKPSNKGLPWAK